jgi:dTMP kinase
MTQGLLIALEGVDGSGTTSQRELVAKALRAQGHTLHTTAEPTTGPIGKLLREILTGTLQTSPQAVALLFAADRLDHLEREIIPQLNQGHIVLTDRYIHSSLAYQSLAMGEDWVMAINQKARTPDLAILVKVSVEVATQRRAERGGPEEIFDAIEAQKKIATAYDKAFEQTNLGPTTCVDGEQSMEAVTQDILKKIAAVVTS